MHVQSPPGAGSFYIPLDGDAIIVGPDDTVEVSDDIGKNLLRQGWLSPDTPRTTVAEILDWVGDDPIRAAGALAEEQAKDDPRVSLVSRLDALIEEND
jgi:hypothetical protein